MNNSLTVATTAALVIAIVLLLAPARADTIYPISPCRVFDDTGYTQIAGQCGTVARAHPRRLFVQAPRRPRYCYGPF
jgi:hypothetical protein